MHRGALLGGGSTPCLSATTSNRTRSKRSSCQSSNLRDHPCKSPAQHGAGRGRGVSTESAGVTGLRLVRGRTTTGRVEHIGCGDTQPQRWMRGCERAFLCRAQSRCPSRTRTPRSRYRSPDWYLCVSPVHGGGGRAYDGGGGVGRRGKAAAAWGARSGIMGGRGVFGSWPS